MENQNQLKGSQVPISQIQSPSPEPKNKRESLMDKDVLKKYSIVVIATLIAIVSFFFAYNKFYHGSNSQPNQAIISNLEDKLLDTAWIHLDQNGQETDFKIDFQKTKENDPLHKSYDYQDYLHQRPGESGYWKVKDNTITIIAYPSDLPPIIYSDVNFTENILQMTEDDNKLKFKRIPSLQEQIIKNQLITDARQIASKYNLINVSLFCVLSDIEKPDDLSITKAVITFREYHGQSDYDNCVGDPATSPRLFSVLIDRTTGKVFTDTNPEIQMEELKLDTIEKEAVGMTLPTLKDKIIAYFKQFNKHTNISDKDFEDFNSYYWVYLRRVPEDEGLSFLKGLAEDEFDYAWNRLGPCFGIPQGQCRE